MTGSTRERAIRLMREAKSHLSSADHAQALLHLERAIDTAERPPSRDQGTMGESEDGGPPR
ncbi:hypothetical protein [Sphingobium yanoikuyae]|uniref:hypothetical protein n=1 Tax=Sphingobium yanoikuyae TaxID=13690 RepID=UPI000B317144|nr:hypothetical protein [Sphingobium yanoikuyae]MDV3480066.1 hypothetical protein [Sphingobium yanoikuyae]